MNQRDSGKKPSATESAPPGRFPAHDDDEADDTLSIETSVSIASTQGDASDTAGPSWHIEPGTGDAAGRYVVQRELARGGMGTVLKVWDRMLQRSIAMKVVLDDAGSDERPEEHAERRQRRLRRFFAEARITGRLNHPGIVQVHEVGADPDGRLYFTMPYVEGRLLSSVFEDVQRGAKGWSLRRAVKILIRICDVMAYAHEQGVVHRDLKPANIMVGRYDEVYVLDWGLAKTLDVELPPENGPAHEAGGRLSATNALAAVALNGDTPVDTLDGTVVGTPNYMSPEQASGRVREIDHRSDIYCLGTILYSLLTGAPPYASRDRQLPTPTVLARLREGPPPALGRSSPKAPRALVRVCEQAMARAPGERYASCGDMANALRVLLSRDIRAVRGLPEAASLRRQLARARAVAISSMVAAAVAAVFGLALLLCPESPRRATATGPGEEETPNPVIVEPAPAAEVPQAAPSSGLLPAKEPQAALREVCKQRLWNAALAPALSPGPATAASTTTTTRQLSASAHAGGGLPVVTCNLLVAPEPEPSDPSRG